MESLEHTAQIRSKVPEYIAQRFKLTVSSNLRAPQGFTTSEACYGDQTEPHQLDNCLVTTIATKQATKMWHRRIQGMDSFTNIPPGGGQ